MSEPFVGEIRMVSFNFAPRGWATCDGQLLPLSQNTALFSLLGTMYGGNGKSNFALPNLQGSAPMMFGQGPGLTDRFQGETGGTATVTLITSEIPAHTHTVNCQNTGAGQASPQNNIWAAAAGRTPPANYQSTAPNTAMSSSAVSLVGGNQPHNNMPPYLVVYFCIALQGVFPPSS